MYKFADHLNITRFSFSRSKIVRTRLELIISRSSLQQYVKKYNTYTIYILLFSKLIEQLKVSKVKTVLCRLVYKGGYAKVFHSHPLLTD